MKIEDVYPNKRLKHEDLGSREVTAEISEVGIAEFDDGKKLEIHFKGKDKSFVCNKTNARILAAAFSDETDAWVGSQVVLYVHQTGLGPGIAVRPIQTTTDAEDENESPF